MKSLRGRMLVAMPDMEDPFFHQSLVLVCEHDEEHGALGFVLNHPINLTVGDLLRSMGMKPGERAHPQRPVFVGGPMQQTRGFGLFLPAGPKDALPGAHEMENGMQVTTSQQLLRRCAEGTEPQNLLLLLGYAGWGEGQLEHELQSGRWWEVGADSEIVFQVPPRDRWGQAVAQMNIDHTAIAPGSGHA